MNIYIYVNENDIIMDVVAISHNVISPNYIEYHEQDMTLVGKLWDRVTSTAVDNPYPDPIIITKLAFRNLFTFNEKVVLYTKAETDIIIRVFLDDIMAAQEIDLTFPSLIQGIQYLVSQGVITAERAGQILANEQVA